MYYPRLPCFITHTVKYPLRAFNFAKREKCLLNIYAVIKFPLTNDLLFLKCNILITTVAQGGERNTRYCYFTFRGYFSVCWFSGYA